MDGQIILYNGPNSPFGRKTKVTALVQEVKIEEKIIDVYKADFLDKYKHSDRIQKHEFNTDKDGLIEFLNRVCRGVTL